MFLMVRLKHTATKSLFHCIASQLVAGVGLCVCLHTFYVVIVYQCKDVLIRSRESRALLTFLVIVHKVLRSHKC